MEGPHTHREPVKGMYMFLHVLVLQSKGEYLPPTPTLFDFRHSLRMVLEANQDGVQHKDLEGIYEVSDLRNLL